MIVDNAHSLKMAFTPYRRTYPALEFGLNGAVFFGTTPKNYGFLGKFKTTELMSSESIHVTDARGNEDSWTYRKVQVSHAEDFSQYGDGILSYTIKVYEGNDCNHWHCMCQNDECLTQEKTFVRENFFKGLQDFLEEIFGKCGQKFFPVPELLEREREVHNKKVLTLLV